MAKPKKAGFEVLKEHPEYVVEVPMMDELILEAVIGSAEPIEDDELDKFLELTEVWHAVKQNYDQLKEGKLIQSDRAHRTIAHRKLMEYDDEYVKQFGKLKKADENLTGEYPDGVKRPPNDNSLIAREMAKKWEKKERRIDRYIDEYNELVEKALASIPQEVKILLDNDESTWKRMKGAK